MKTEDVIDKLRLLKIDYINQGVGKNPALLPQHFADFLGYATLLYDHYSEFIMDYEKLETKIIKEENAAREATNATAEKREDKVSMAEVQQRIDVRLGTEKGKRKRLELVVKGATLHINGCQSLMKNWGDEAKGIR
jgi:hypothetical protein